MKTKFQYKMTKQGKDPKGNDFKEIICKNKTQKAAFQKYGFKSETIGLDPKATKQQLLEILYAQEGKVTKEQQVMTKEQLIQLI